MEFRYGISPQSLSRWLTFERICSIQAERGPDVGRAAMARLIEEELAAVERATAEYERQTVEALRSK